MCAFEAETIAIMMVFEHVRQLYDQKLYSNVTALVPLVLAANDYQGNQQLLTQNGVLHTMVLYADSLRELREFARAEVAYRKALQLRKHYPKSKVGIKDLPSETDIKYHVHLCHVAMKQPVQAVIILQSIPAKERTTKVNMALANLYVQTGMERSAVKAYKEVVKECPLAMEALNGLVKLGVSSSEIFKLIFDGSPPPPHLVWLEHWIKGQLLLYSRDFAEAFKTFKLAPMKENVPLLVSLATSFYMAGNSNCALDLFQRSQAIDPLHLKGMDLLATILYSERKVAELETLATRIVTINEARPEGWVAIGYASLLQKKHTRALYLAHKACTAAPANIEALLLKANVLQDMKKHTEAVSHYREALQLSAHRLETYRGLVECYTAMQRLKEAIHIAANALHTVGHNVRSLTLYASVLLMDSATLSKGRSILEKAIGQDPCHWPAVELLVNSLVQAGKQAPAIEILKKHIACKPSGRAHHLLGDLYVCLGEKDKGLDHFTHALALDPTNTKALEASNRLESALVGSLGHSSELEAEDVPESDEEGIEDAEAGWSDVEFSPYPR